jgi:thymidylate synthase (FAD)
MFEKHHVEVIQSMGTDLTACQAARVSFLKDVRNDDEVSERDARLIDFLVREGHTSPFEHSVITFRITAALPVVAQIMRHRTFSYNQASRRYTSEDIEFYDVNEWRAQATKNLQCSEGALSEDVAQEIRGVYREHCVRSLKIYEWMLEKGVSREQARFVLPQGLIAKFWMTGSLHNYIKFLRLRDTAHAQGECREVAADMRRLLTERFPLAMSAAARTESVEH